MAKHFESSSSISFRLLCLRLRLVVKSFNLLNEVRESWAKQGTIFNNDSTGQCVANHLSNFHFVPSHISSTEPLNNQTKKINMNRRILFAATYLELLSARNSNSCSHLLHSTQCLKALHTCIFLNKTSCANVKLWPLKLNKNNNYVIRYSHCRQLFVCNHVTFNPNDGQSYNLWTFFSLIRVAVSTWIKLKHWTVVFYGIVLQLKSLNYVVCKQAIYLIFTVKHDINRTWGLLVSTGQFFSVPERIGKDQYWLWSQVHRFRTSGEEELEAFRFDYEYKIFY